MNPRSSAQLVSPLAPSAVADSRRAQAAATVCGTLPRLSRWAASPRASPTSLCETAPWADCCPIADNPCPTLLRRYHLSLPSTATAAGRPGRHGRPGCKAPVSAPDRHGRPVLRTGRPGRHGVASAARAIASRARTVDRGGLWYPTDVSDIHLRALMSAASASDIAIPNATHFSRYAPWDTLLRRCLSLWPTLSTPIPGETDDF